MRILLCEDAPRLAEAEAEVLRKQGYGVDIATDGERAEELALTGAHDCVLLDIMLPKKSGLEVLQALRTAGSSVPVILLTARTGVGDRVAGLDAGADDYLPKPFHASELLARIRAVTRRPPALRSSACRASRDAELDMDSLLLRAATASGACDIALTPREARLLEKLMARAGAPVAKSELIASLWGPSTIGGKNRLEVLVHALRAKLADAGAVPRIETVRGVGYRWTEASATRNEGRR